MFKVDSAALCKTFHAFHLAAQRSGAYGVNIALSNAIAGIFAAAGQDLACVHESSWAVMDVRAEEKISVAGIRPLLNRERSENREINLRFTEYFN